MNINQTNKTLTSPIVCLSQNYFQREIIYNTEIIKKDSLFDLSNIPSWPSKTTKVAYKNGNYIQWPDDGLFEYQFFNRTLNQVFYKVRGADTLIFENYNKRSPELGPVLSLTNDKNTDTVLNKVCNRLVLQTNSIKLTFIYNPELKINPDWYRNTKGAYCDIVYGQMKSVYLKCIIEGAQFMSIIEAREIIHKPVPDNIFPDVANLPKRY